jgi:hypothetical protein
LQAALKIFAHDTGGQSILIGGKVNSFVPPGGSAANPAWGKTTVHLSKWPSFQQAFWGENYERLLEIKTRVDPEDVFWCKPCVGKERWEEVENMLCRT